MKRFTQLFMAIMIFAMTSIIQAQQNDGLIGLYTFDNDLDRFENTAPHAGIGTVKCDGVMRFKFGAPSTSEDDILSVENTDSTWSVIDGVMIGKAIALKAHNWFKIWHGIGKNGGGDWVNDFTIVVDVRITEPSGIFSLVEVNPTPTANGFTSEMEIDTLRLGSVGAPASGEDVVGHSENQLSVDTWYRIAYVADLSDSISMYVNGVLWKQAHGNFLDARPAPYTADYHPDDAAMKIGGNNERYPANDPARDGDKDIDMVAIYNKTVTADVIAILGDPGTWVGVRDNVRADYNYLSLYPNPATDILNYKVTNAVKLEIFNMTGQLCESREVNSQNSSINVSHLSRGIYFVKVTTEEGKQVSRKLILE